MKRPEKLTEKQTVKLAELLRYNLKSVRSYLLREDFQRFWEYVSPGWAGKFLDQWCTRSLRSRIEPMKNVARSLPDGWRDFDTSCIGMGHPYLSSHYGLLVSRTAAERGFGFGGYLLPPVATTEVLILMRS